MDRPAEAGSVRLRCYLREKGREEARPVPVALSLAWLTAVPEECREMKW